MTKQSNIQHGFLALVLALCGLTAFASEKPITITTRSCEVTRDQLAAIVQTIRSIDEMLGVEGVELPAMVTIRMGKQAGAGFAAATGEILLPCPAADATEAGSDGIALAHEYGHSIFEIQLRKVLSNRAWLFARKEELHKNHGSPEELAAIIKELSVQQRVSGKYSEFFADLVAVIYARDPAAMVHLLIERNSTLPPDRYVLRDFTRFHAKEWRKLPDVLKADPHLVFHPFKVSLWTKTAARSFEMLAIFSPAVLRTIMSEVKVGVDLPQEHAKLSVAELNRGLIRELPKSH